MITHVGLKNWKSHKRSELKLGPGTNVLVGIMGSGKSAVLDAITYGLFGTVPAVKNRKITLDDLIRKRPEKKNSAEIEIGFSTPEGEDYIVKRVLERGKGTTLAELRRADGDLINKPKSTEVTEDVTSLLQIDYDFFERMIYAEQNELDQFLTLEPRKRRERIDELLKINKFENARKRGTTLINRLKDRKEDRRKDLKELQEDEDIESLPSLEKELEETKSERLELKEKKQDIEPQLREVNEKLQKYEKIRKRADEISSKIDKIKTKVEMYQEQIKKAKDKLGGDVEADFEILRKRKENFKNSLEESKAEVKKLDSKARDLTARVSSLETEKESLTKKIDDLLEKIEEKEEKKEKFEEMDLSKLKRELEELKKKREEQKDYYSELKVKSKNLRKSLKELQEAGPNCPVCDRPLTDERREELIEKRESKIEDTNRMIEKLEEGIEDIEESISKKTDGISKAEDLEKEIENLPELRSKLSEKKTELEEKSERLEQKRGEEEEVREALEEAKNEVENVRKQYENAKDKIELREDLEAFKGKIEDLMKDKKNLKSSLKEKESKYDSDLVKKIGKRKENIIKKQERLKTRLNEINKLIDEKEKLVRSVRKKKETLERREVEVEVLKNSISSLEKVKKAMSRTQTSLRGQVIEAVNSMMNDIWNDIYPYEDFQKIRLSIEETRETSDYELQLMDSSKSWISVEGMTSGGERTCAVLTLRIAFAVVLSPGLSWLVLDEPTHNLDSEGIDQLAEVLRERVPRIVKQLLLITHERRLESAVSGYLYRFSRNKSQDEPTEIERVYEEG